MGLFPTQDIDFDQGDEAEGEGPGGRYQSHVFQQSVTLTARMWPDEGGTVAPPTSAWRLPSEHLALLVGAVTGGALVLALLAALIIWRCCLLPQRNKQYSTRMAEEMAARHRSSMPVLQSHCAVFADAKKGHWAYNSRLVGNTFTPDPGTHWFYNSRVLSSANLERIDPGPLSRSISYVHEQQRHPVLINTNRKRPLSQPIRFGPCDFPNGIDCRRKHLPEISEFSTQPTQYASSSILDDSGCQGGEWIPGAALKTRSLPAWVRSRPRPLSTEDNLAELYAKVNFSKKRKNRMRNDEAAIIALSKSRSQYLHKDTDSLVDNEAVIVYDERTAL